MTFHFIDSNCGGRLTILDDYCYRKGRVEDDNITF